MLTDCDEDVLAWALEKWGPQFQLQMLAEECSELATECLHSLRGRPDHLAEEMADVYIMLYQVSLVVCPKEVRKAIERKMERLKERLKDDS